MFKSSRTYHTPISISQPYNRPLHMIQPSPCHHTTFPVTSHNDLYAGIQQSLRITQPSPWQLNGFVTVNTQPSPCKNTTIPIQEYNHLHTRIQPSPCKNTTLLASHNLPPCYHKHSNAIIQPFQSLHKTIPYPSYHLTTISFLSYNHSTITITKPF